MKRTSQLCRLAVLLMAMATIFTSVKQLRTDSPMCVGFPCVSGVQCGSACFCDQTNWVCMAPILD